MSTLRRSAIGLLPGAVLVAASIALLHSGVYGFTVFLLAPMALGGLVSWVFRPSTGGGAAGMGALGVLAAAGLLFGIGMEGAICVLISLPLTMPLGALGGLLVYWSSSSRAAAQGGAALLLLAPASLIWDTHARPPVYKASTAIVIAAPPDRVWQEIVTLSKLPEPDEWYFRAGLAYPTQARIEGAGAGATRYCEFSTGPVVESIEVWDAPRLMRFRVTETPAAMREWTPYAEVSPRHLRGYFISREGEFRLTPLPGNRTLLEGASWYQHGLWPAAYWRWLSDAIVHRIHLRVFNRIKLLAEAGAR